MCPSVIFQVLHFPAIVILWSVISCYCKFGAPVCRSSQIMVLHPTLRIRYLYLVVSLKILILYPQFYVICLLIIDNLCHIKVRTYTHINYTADLWGKAVLCSLAPGRLCKQTLSVRRRECLRNSHLSIHQHVAYRPVCALVDLGRDSLQVTCNLYIMLN